MSFLYLMQLYMSILEFIEELANTKLTSQTTTSAIELIRKGDSNPGLVDRHSGNTALILACSKNLPKVALELIKTKQSNPGHVNMRGETALTSIFTSEPFQPEVALKLIETGQSNPGHVNEYSGETALMLACEYILTNVALALIKTGESNPGHVNEYNSKTALMMACENILSKVALALIETGESNPGHVNENDGYTALMWACRYRLTKVALPLIDTGKSNPGHMSNDGHTALFFAEKNHMHSVDSRLRYILLDRKKYKMPIIHKSLSHMSMANDVIGLEDVKIKTFLLSDRNNVAFLINNNWFLFNKKVIQNLADSKDSIVYKCNSASGLPSNTNVDSSTEYFRLKSIGLFIDYVPMTYIYSLLQSRHQYYMFEPTSKTLPSVVSYNVYQNRNKWVPGLHCEEGQGGKVYIMRRVTIHNTPTRKTKEMDPRLTKYQSKEKKEEYGSSIMKQNTPQLSKSKTRKRTIHYSI